MWSKYFTFCFVRNPWDWAVSGWHHVTANKPSYFIAPTFDEFVRGKWWQDIDESHVRKNYNTIRLFVEGHTQMPQWKHLKISWWQGLAPYSFIGRYENLEEDWRTICERIGLPHVSLQHRNRSRDRRHYSAYYTDETKEIVAKRNKKLIERFGYSFEEA